MLKTLKKFFGHQKIKPVAAGRNLLQPKKNGLRPKVKRKLNHKTRTIVKKRRFLRKPTINGATQFYLGRPHRLICVKGSDKGIKLKHGKMWLTTINITQVASLQAIIKAWYRQRAEEILLQRFEKCYRQVYRRLGINKPDFKVRAMNARWGSCTAHGKILLNPDLVKMPITCIDYVIIHELCHLREHNHSKKFYALLDLVLPTWQNRKQRLDELGGIATD